MAPVSIILRVRNWTKETRFIYRHLRWRSFNKGKLQLIPLYPVKLLKWRVQRGLNPRPHAWQACALTKLSYEPMQPRFLSTGRDRTRGIFLLSKKQQEPTCAHHRFHSDKDLHLICILSGTALLISYWVHMEDKRIELFTSWMQIKRSTKWTNPPNGNPRRISRAIPTYSYGQIVCPTSDLNT